MQLPDDPPPSAPQRGRQSNESPTFCNKFEENSSWKFGRDRTKELETRKKQEMEESTEQIKTIPTKRTNMRLTDANGNVIRRTFLSARTFHNGITTTLAETAKETTEETTMLPCLGWAMKSKKYPVPSTPTEETRRLLHGKEKWTQCLTKEVAENVERFMKKAIRDETESTTKLFTTHRSRR